jgi:hypothetical protein
LAFGGSDDRASGPRIGGSGGVSATYNGDGVLVQRGATVYTQDLAAGLSQVLVPACARMSAPPLTSERGTVHVASRES